MCVGGIVHVLYVVKLPLLLINTSDTDLNPVQEMYYVRWWKPQRSVHLIPLVGIWAGGWREWFAVIQPIARVRYQAQVSWFSHQPSLPTSFWTHRHVLVSCSALGCTAWPSRPANFLWRCIGTLVGPGTEALWELTPSFPKSSICSRGNAHQYIKSVFNSWYSILNSILNIF